MNNSTDFREVTDSPALANLSQPFLTEECRLLSRNEQQRDLAETFRQTKNNSHRVPKLSACRQSFRQWHCENGHDFAVPEFSCGERLCPHCAHHRAGVLTKRLQKFLLARDVSRCRYAVLTIKNVDSLAEGREFLMDKAWTSLRRSVFWKQYVEGAMAVFETTFDPEKRWHPHLNVLMEGDYIPVDALRQAWMKATKGRGEIVWIQAVTPGTAQELIKYTCKTTDLIGQPAAVDEFQAAMKGKRLVRTYGTFYALPVEDEDNPGVVCPICADPDVAVVQCGYVYPSVLMHDARCLRDDKYGVKASPPEEIEHWKRKATEFNTDAMIPRMRPPSPLLAKWDAAAKAYLAARCA